MLRYTATKFYGASLSSKQCKVTPQIECQVYTGDSAESQAMFRVERVEDTRIYVAWFDGIDNGDGTYSAEIPEFDEIPNSEIVTNTIDRLTLKSVPRDGWFPVEFTAWRRESGWLNTEDKVFYSRSKAQEWVAGWDHSFVSINDVKPWFWVH